MGSTSATRDSPTSLCVQDDDILEDRSFCMFANRLKTVTYKQNVISVSNALHREDTRSSRKFDCILQLPKVQSSTTHYYKSQTGTRSDTGSPTASQNVAGDARSIVSVHWDLDAD